MPSAYNDVGEYINIEFTRTVMITRIELKRELSAHPIMAVRTCSAQANTELMPVLRRSLEWHGDTTMQIVAKNR